MKCFALVISNLQNPQIMCKSLYFSATAMLDPPLLIFDTRTRIRDQLPINPRVKI